MGDIISFRAATPKTDRVFSSIRRSRRDPSQASTPRARSRRAGFDAAAAVPSRSFHGNWGSTTCLADEKVRALGHVLTTYSNSTRISTDRVYGMLRGAEVRQPLNLNHIGVSVCKHSPANC